MIRFIITTDAGGDYRAETLEQAREIAATYAGAEIIEIPEALREGRDCATFGHDWEHYGLPPYDWAWCRHCDAEA